MPHIMPTGSLVPVLVAQVIMPLSTLTLLLMLVVCLDVGITVLLYRDLFKIDELIYPTAEFSFVRLRRMSNYRRSEPSGTRAASRPRHETRAIAYDHDERLLAINPSAP